MIQFDLSATTVAEGTKNITTWQIQKISVTTGEYRYCQKFHHIKHLFSDAGKLETVDLRAESIHGGVAYSCITGFTANLTDGTNRYSFQNRPSTITNQGDVFIEGQVFV